ncbi:hypothetical protein EG329_001880 [Mollisiaceae sp. DMI_Dod_QoI]|nr:hypothetical protein EG329_001880 [Helotiales sp. DMI_Dod_QoI]
MPGALPQGISSNLQSGVMPHSTISVTAGSLQHRVKYDFTGQSENEATVKTGDLVVITEKNESGWWLAKVEGKLGWLPGAYVEEVIIRSASTVPPPVPASESPVIRNALSAIGRLARI